MLNLNYKRISDRELLGMLVPETAARELLDRFGTLEEILIHAQAEELLTVKSVGERQVQKLKATEEIIKRLLRPSEPASRVIRNPTDIYHICQDIQFLKQEEMRALYLNTKNAVMGIETISLGTVDSSPVNPRDVYSRAVRLMVKSAIIVHNHPSGDPTPSENDRVLTERLKQAGEYLGIGLLDHVIIGKGRYISFKEMGWL